MTITIKIENEKITLDLVKKLISDALLAKDLSNQKDDNQQPRKLSPQEIANMGQVYVFPDTRSYDAIERFDWRWSNTKPFPYDDKCGGFSVPYHFQTRTGSIPKFFIDDNGYIKCKKEDLLFCPEVCHEQRKQ